LSRAQITTVENQGPTRGLPVAQATQRSLVRFGTGPPSILQKSKGLSLVEMFERGRPTRS